MKDQVRVLDERDAPDGEVSRPRPLAARAKEQVWAVVPAKDLGQAKSRLAPFLRPWERERLMRRLLSGTMAALRGAPSLAGWLLVSPDSRLLALAQESGGEVLREQPGGGDDDLNAALRQAREAVLARGATALLVVPGDLPLVSSEGVEALLEAARQGAHDVVVAPDHDGRGTNALLLSPPTALDFSFGPDSAARHVAAARAAGLSLALHRAAEFALDLDTPSDFEAVARLQGQWLDAPMVSYG